jgi:hypothetical protein
MRILFSLLILLAALPAAAAEPPAPPSDDSLRQLFETMHTTRMLDSYMRAVDSGMQTGIRSALSGRTPTARQQQIIDDMRAQLVNAMRETLSWEKLEPLFLEVYRHNFTQREVNDMLTFYRSPSGRSVVDKLPAAMQQASQAVQGMLPDLVQKLQQIQNDSLARLKAADDEGPKSR